MRCKVELQASPTMSLQKSMAQLEHLMIEYRQPSHKLEVLVEENLCKNFCFEVEYLHSNLEYIYYSRMCYIMN